MSAMPIGMPGCPEFARSTASMEDRKSTRLNSSHSQISYAVFCLKKKKNIDYHLPARITATVVVTTHGLRQGTLTRRNRDHTGSDPDPKTHDGTNSNHHHNEQSYL